MKSIAIVAHGRNWGRGFKKKKVSRYFQLETFSVKMTSPQKYKLKPILNAWFEPNTPSATLIFKALLLLCLWWYYNLKIICQGAHQWGEQFFPPADTGDPCEKHFKSKGKTHFWWPQQHSWLPAPFSLGHSLTASTLLLLRTPLLPNTKKRGPFLCR